MPPPAQKTLQDVLDLTDDVVKTGVAKSGVKEECALGQLPYYDFIKAIKSDAAHCGKNIWQSSRSALCATLANKELKEPEKPNVENLTLDEKKKIEKKYKAKVADWKKRCADRDLVLEDAKHVALSEEDLLACDVRYGWACSPGLADGDRTIMHRKGDLIEFSPICSFDFYQATLVLIVSVL